MFEMSGYYLKTDELFNFISNYLYWWGTLPYKLKLQNFHSLWLYRVLKLKKNMAISLPGPAEPKGQGDNRPQILEKLAIFSTNLSPYRWKYSQLQ